MGDLLGLKRVGNRCIEIALFLLLMYWNWNVLVADVLEVKRVRRWVMYWS